jgi:hypothetical protein
MQLADRSFYILSAIFSGHVASRVQERRQVEKRKWVIGFTTRAVVVLAIDEESGFNRIRIGGDDQVD